MKKMDKWMVISIIILILWIVTFILKRKIFKDGKKES